MNVIGPAQPRGEAGRPWPDPAGRPSPAGSLSPVSLILGRPMNPPVGVPSGCPEGHVEPLMVWVWGVVRRGESGWDCSDIAVLLAAAERHMRLADLDRSTTPRTTLVGGSYVRCSTPRLGRLPGLGQGRVRSLRTGEEGPIGPLWRRSVSARSPARPEVEYRRAESRSSIPGSGSCDHRGSTPSAVGRHRVRLTPGPGSRRCGRCHSTFPTAEPCRPTPGRIVYGGGPPRSVSSPVFEGRWAPFPLCWGPCWGRRQRVPNGVWPTGRRGRGVSVGGVAGSADSVGEPPRRTPRGRPPRGVGECEGPSVVTRRRTLTLVSTYREPRTWSVKNHVLEREARRELRSRAPGGEV